MNNKSSYWVKTLQNGVIGGGISLLLGVVGLALAFGKTYVISGVITMGQIFVLAPFLFEAYLSVRQCTLQRTLQPPVGRRVDAGWWEARCWRHSS